MGAAKIYEDPIVTEVAPASKFTWRGSSSGILPATPRISPLRFRGQAESPQKSGRIFWKKLKK